MNAPRPNVSIDPDLRLDDRTAERLVESMLKALTVDAAHLRRQIDRVFNDEPLGNAKAMRRAVKRCQRAAGKSFLHADIHPDRRQSRIFFDAFDVVDNQLHVQQIIIEQDPGRRLIDFDHRLRRNFVRTSVAVGKITKHALVRLLQRAGCRTPEEVLDIVRRVAWIILTTVPASEFGKLLPKENQPGWLLPIVGPRGGLCYLPMRRSDPDLVSPGIITTALSHDMIKNWEALVPLLDLIRRTYDTPPEWRPMEEWRAAFELSATALRRA